MSEGKDEPVPLGKDDELLANAIPIDESMLEEDDADDTAPAAKPAAKPKAGDSDTLDGLDLEEASETGGPSKIRALGRATSGIDESRWRRKPNANGQGAVHVRTFVAKLRMDAIEHLDEVVNEWLDNHPDFEVKHVTTVVGELTGKLKEPALFLSVWV